LLQPLPNLSDQVKPMDTDSFVRLATSQEIVEVRRRVSVHGPVLEALIAQGKITLLSDILADRDQHEEDRLFRHKHILEPGAGSSAIATWMAAHPHHPLPRDLVSFLEQVNGVHLWADIETSRSYYGILPLCEWRDAGTALKVMYDVRPQHQLVLSYHDNGDYFLVLDTKNGAYFWYDLEDFDNPKLIGSSVAELLAWYWQQASELDPRRETNV
jgi:hypothetical protein